MNVLFLLLDSWIEDEFCSIPIFDLLLESGFPNIAELWFANNYTFNCIISDKDGRKMITKVIQEDINKFEITCKRDKEICDTMKQYASHYEFYKRTTTYFSSF